MRRNINILIALVIITAANGMLTKMIVTNVSAKVAEQERITLQQWLEDREQQQVGIAHQADRVRNYLKAKKELPRDVYELKKFELGDRRPIFGLQDELVDGADLPEAARKSYPYKYLYSMDFLYTTITALDRNGQPILTTQILGF